MPGETMLRSVHSLAHLATSRAELVLQMLQDVVCLHHLHLHCIHQGTLFITNMHIIYNPQFVYTPEQQVDGKT